MKKIINVITLIVMTSVNIMTPFSYADSLGDDFLETENIETTSQETETFEDEENDEIDIYSNEDLQREEDSQPSELPIEDEIQKDGELTDSLEENIQDNEGDTQTIDLSDNSTDVESGEVKEIDSEISIDFSVDITEGQIETGENQQAKTGTNNTVLDSSFLSTIEEEDFSTSSSFSGDNEENLEQNFTGENLDDYSESEEISQDSLINDSEGQDEENLDIDEEGKRFDSENIQDIVDKIRYFFTEQKSAKYIKYDEDENEIGIITLRDPETSSTITIMDRNLGAEDTGIGEKSYGYYFQWGNNHGIEEINPSNTTTKKAIYDDSYFSKGYDGNGLFIVGDKDYREDGNHYNSLWGDDSKEISRQASCPTGYHIPTAKEWNELMGIWGKIHTQYTEINEEGETFSKTRYTVSSSLKNIASFKYSAEKCEQGDSECVDEDNLSEIIPVLSSELKLPLAGSYDEDGNFTKNVGIYWSTTSKNGSEAVVFDIDAYFTDIENETLGYKSQGHSIRCFQNVEKEETPTTVISQYEQENQNGENSPSVDLSSDLNGENEETENLQFGTGENVAIDMLKEIVDNENNNSTLDEYIQTEETTENIIPTDSSVEVLEGQVGSEVSTKTSITSVVAGETSSLTGEVLQSEEEINEQEEFTGINLELATAWETLNAELIKKVGLYNNVIVNVEAPAGTFPEGTYANIRPIVSESRLNEIKGQIIEEDNTISQASELVAFDISFIYILSGGEEIEVQPKNGDGVRVVFNYENNENLSEGDVNDEQEIKVFHIEDKDENGEKVAQGEEIVKDVTNRVESEEAGIAVADAESFSIYAVVTTTGSPATINVTHNLNGGYWLDGNDLADPRTIEYTCVNNSCTTTTHYRTPKKDGYMFMGWYTGEDLTNRRKDGVATDGMTVYAKWQDFNDLNVYVLKDDEHKYQYTLMDRNMGATGIYTNSLTINPESRGYYYQWGNNYGFDSYAENNGALSNSGTTKINVSGFSRNEPYYSATFVKQTASTNAEWTTGLNRDLWGDGNIKTNEAKQGPCPSGYHIPSENDWKGVLSGWTSVNYRENKNFYFDFLIPSAGIRNRGYDNKDVAKVVNIDRYRYASSSRNGTNFNVKAIILLTSTGINVLPIVSYHVSNPKDMAHERSSNGLSVRCFKNTTGGAIDASNIDLNGGGGGILSITSGVVVSFQSPTRGNDEFLGFYTNSGYLGEPIDSVGDIIPEGTTYLYAKWNVGGLYTITYHDAIETDVVYTGAYGTSTADAVAPTWSKEGYTLTWSAEKPSTYPAENIIINSVWTANTYKIHFNGNGATSGSMVDQDFTYDEGLKPLTANIFENEGYLFKGWATSPNGIIIYSDEEPVQNLRSQSGAVVNLYAKWGEQCGEYEEEGPDGNCYISAEGQRIAQIVSDLDMFLLVSDGNAYNKHVTLMDRNMGATDRFDGNMSNPNEGSKGYLYQWGNNYGFPSTGTLAEHNVFTTTGQTKKTDWEKGIPSKYSSMIYYLNSDNNGNWMQGSSTSDGIWGGTGDTTDTMGPTTSSEGRQGPCPVGYHVPSSVEYSGLYLIYQTIKSKNKEDFSKDFLIPPVGRRAGNGNLGNTGDISYWSSSPYPGNSNRALGVWRSDSEMKIGNDDGRARARSVRCVKNVANTRATTIDINDIHLNGGTKVFISIDSGIILTLGTPTLTSAQSAVANFEGWYTTSGFSGNPITTGMNIEAGSSLYAKYTCKDSAKIWNGSDCITAEYSGCIWNEGVIAHGTSVTGYLTPTVPYGQTCVSEIRTCNDGTLSGTYQYASCIPEAASTCNLPWGGTVSDGTSVTGYKLPSQTCPAQCSAVSQIATCNNGRWSVADFETTYINSGCTTNPVEISAKYPLNSCPEHGNCDVITGYTINNNICITGDTKYKLNDCESGWHTEDNVTCTGNTKYEACTPRQGNEKPEHSSNLAGIVPVNWVEGSGWETPAKCDWICDTHYHTGDDLNSCDIDTFVVTINADANSGSVSTGILEIDYGTVLTTSGNELRIGEEVVSEATENPSDAQYTHRFVDWTNGCTSVVTTGCEITANFESITREYLITFVDGDGKTIQTGMVMYGVIPAYTGTETPNKTATPQTGYTFNGNWSPSIHSVEGEEIYTAQFEEETRSYDITWKYETQTGTQIETGSYLYGAIPSHSGNNYQTAQTGYTFSGWKPEITSVTGPAEYEAEYNETTREYLITFVDGDGKTIQTGMVMYGATPAYTGTETPNKTATPQTGYTFNGNWSPTIHSVEGEEIYTAQFNEETRSYDIIWDYRNENGLRTRKIINVEYGKNPTEPSLPIISQTAQTGYTFTGWNPEVSEVTTGARYTAQYEEITREYLIIFVDGDGKIIQTGMVMYGVTPAYTGTETPTKTATPQYSYNFNYTWEPEIIPVETGAEYTAQFDEIINKYIVTINADANSGSVSTGTIEIEYGTSITESGNELKIGDITVIATAKLSDAQYTHTFIDWTNSCASAVTTGCEITANFESTINEYQITFDSNGGSDVDTQTKQYGLTVDEPPDPNKTGYGFSGWFYEGLETKFDFENTTISGDLTLYAKWTPIIYTISYNYNNGSLTGESTNPSNYTIETDTFTLNNPERVGYDFLGWTGTDFEGLSRNVIIMSGSTGNREYTANWQARNVTVTINHHLQDLNAETNELLSSYTLSGSTTSQELADSTITLSNYKQIIEGYTYSSGGVNGEPTITTTVSPDGSREIDLYYTRNSYVLTITSDTGANITGTSTSGNYYYGAEIILSGDVDSDCFMWSGWDVQGTTLINNINNTSFHMPANDVTVNASVTEKTYNVLFVGNGEDSGEMEELTGLRCTQPVELPVNKFGKVGHNFSGWTTTVNGEKEYEDGDTITTLTTGNNATVSLIAIWDINYYPVVFQNYNGVVLDSQSVPFGTIPEYKGSTAPSRAADAQYTYSFTGWTPEFTAVEGSQVYTAVFSTTINEYTITWDVDGTLTTQTYQYGQTPNPEGINIAKASTPQYEYTFSGWSPQISMVIGDGTYTAQYTETLRKYTVTWRNHNGALLKEDKNVPYGTVPHYNGVTPARTGDAQHSYTFTGWNDGTNTYGKDESLPGVSGNVTYSAVFVGNTNEYTVTWKNEDGTILEYDENVPYGTMPSYDGETPYKTGDQQYDYVFVGWSPATGEVTSDAVYAATYTPVLKKYTVTWKNSDGSIIKTDTGVEYGTTPEYIGDTPTSGGNAEYSYEFTGWNPVVGEIHGDTTYTAVYTHKKNKYTVIWANRDGAVLETVENVEYGVTPTHGDITPIKTGDAHYSYNFIGWEPEISAVQGNITYIAQFEEIENYYNVTFVNDDGSTLLETRSYVYGTTWDQIIKPTNTPIKAEDVQYTYTFVGWTPSISEVIGDVTFKATYTPTLKTYTVTWNNYDGTELKIDENVPYGTTPSYIGETPSKPSTAQYSYVFIGWEPEISAVQGDISYTAKFTGVTEVYTVTWQNEDGAVLEVDHDVIYGTMPEYNGDTPYKTGNMEYEYIFDGWTPEPVAVSATVTYTAKFRPETKKYTVTWQNEDGAVLETDLEVPYGTVPHYDGATPVKTGNAQYSYEFDKWSPDVNTVQGDMTYTATFTEIINRYTVIWENEDGTVLETDEDIPYGTKPEYHGETPTKTGNVQYSYSFKGWDKEVLEIEGDTTYIARYTQSINEYLITFVDGDENIIQTGMVAYGENPTYTGVETPIKTRTQEYTYTFNGNWSPAIHSVDGPETYIAQFDASTNKYKITINANTNSGSVSTGMIEIEYGTPITTSGNKLKIGETTVVATAQPSDAQYTHEFSGWNNSCGTTLQSGCIIEAEFRSIVNEYLIIFVDGDENIIQTGMMAYGENPAYTGTQTPNKTSTPQTGYTFNGNWSPAIHSVDGQETYKAQFDATTNKYTITINANTNSGSVSTGMIEIEYGTPITTSGNELKIGETTVVATVQPSDAQYTHEFSGWNNSCGTTLQSECIIEAEFRSTINKYRIIWKDRDGTQLEKDENVPYGAMPSYDGLTPTSGGDAQYSYKFNGWNPVTGTVKGNAVYTATYIQSINEYLITFIDGDGKTIQTGMVAYGSTPNYTGSTPTKARTQEYTYMFNGTWNPTIHSVITGETYTAQFISTKNKYNLTIEVNTNSGSINTGLITAEYGTPITISGNKLKIGETTVVATAQPSDAQYTHEFSGWNNSCGTTLKNNCTIKAEFRSIVNKYTVTWQNEDGSLLETHENVLYGTMPHYDGIEPTKPGDSSGDYIFNGWNPTPINVIGDVVYTAKYKEKVSPDGGNNEGKRRSGGGGRIIIEEIDHHGSAEEQDMNEAEKEVFDAYKRAYKYGITTMKTEQEADPDGYVIRGHLAKMVVNFAANVLGRGMPVDTPTQCKRNDKDSEWESEEIKFYAEKACALGIMGIYMEEFMPNKIVDRAEFGTVVSRLLWGNIYDELDTDNNLFYTKHLKALQESGFMKDIDNPLGRREFRKRVWVTLKRIELEKNKK